MADSQVKTHYDTHLQSFYSWMMGSFDECMTQQQAFFETYNILPQGNKVAIDLGAGHGIQSVALATQGFEVTAIDFNKKLLAELQQNAGDLIIHTQEDNIQHIKKYAHLQPELIGCWGDTLAHLVSDRALETFIQDVAACLKKGSKFLCSFRNYSTQPSGTQEFIPVKSDNERLLTCVLNYEAQKVRVTDLLWEKKDEEWQQKVSSYYKIKISPGLIERLLHNNGFNVQVNALENGLHHIIAQKIK
ncbi:bifunctional 2-polyprenyl-6-hydroxyphenol methylase/3-demethylubiquinol 3-O-methyltransferase UbiG [uncultured Microscilla sp.]|uniref:class I SAM-dependent methyltransferase n=1 Tax=uncultured Microscilla sp. TaxID=432653 RepID=UPI0026307840|nr:class I SAM-dependent methyltransferase [uncultured Microscilla sp.]